MSVGDYTEQEVNCYGPYPAGAGLALYADPLAAYLDLSHHLGGDPDAVIAAMKSSDNAQRYDAIRRVEAAGRVAFGMVPFDPQTGGGAQLPDVLAVVRDFLIWLKKKEGSGADTPPSPSPGSQESCPAPSPT